MTRRTALNSGLVPVAVGVALHQSPSVQTTATSTAESITDLLVGLGNFSEAVSAAGRDNGGGHFNPSLFWQVTSKNGGGGPGGEPSKATAGAFGSLDEFRQGMGKAAMGQLGSGWAWLVYDRAQN